MPELKTSDKWLYHYSMLSAENRKDPLSAMTPLAFDTNFMRGRSKLMLVYATAEHELIKKKDYSSHNWFPLLDKILTCWLVCYDIVKWNQQGKLRFITQSSSSDQDHMFVIETSKALVKESGSKENPIRELFKACSCESLFSVRDHVWQAFTDVMISTYTNGDTQELRSTWIMLFKKSILLWELCYRLRELILIRSIDYFFIPVEK